MTAALGAGWTAAVGMAALWVSCKPNCNEFVSSPFLLRLHHPLLFYYKWLKSSEGRKFYTSLARLPSHAQHGAFTLPSRQRSSRKELM
eukprot:352100-Chlamydomonas_euryale.AAC.6